MSEQEQNINTRIWDVDAEPDNPFAVAAAYCHGYDVFGDLLTKARWVEYLFLLFRGERPISWQIEVLERLALALANPGPLDYSVRAAMNAGVGRSTAASTLIAALAVGAGNLGGGREIYVAMELWTRCGLEIGRWRAAIENPPHGERADIWRPMEHPPGFDPHGISCTTPVRQVLVALADKALDGGNLRWLLQHRAMLEEVAGLPLALSGVAAAALVDLGFSSSEGELLYLLLRLPGAAVHGLEQRDYGWRRYPFFDDGLVVPEAPCDGRESEG